MRYSKCLTQFYLFQRHFIYFSWRADGAYFITKPYLNQPCTFYTDEELKAFWFLNKEQIIAFAKEMPDWKSRYYRLKKYVMRREEYEIK